MLGEYFIGRHQWENVDKNPLPAELDVEEVGATSAPLLSASYFIGAKCKPYNDDFLLCKDENNGGTIDCLKEGKRVTKCAISVLSDINKYCFEEFKLHYTCLEQNNHNLSGCRSSEQIFNKCVFANLKLAKEIPGAREQIHLKENVVFKTDSTDKKLVKEFLKQKESN